MGEPRGDRTAGTRRIRGVEYTIDELNQTESELTRAIKDMGYETELTARVSRVISNKIGFVRSVVVAQEWLVRNNIATLEETADGRRLR